MDAPRAPLTTFPLGDIWYQGATPTDTRHVRVDFYDLYIDTEHSHAFPRWKWAAERELERGSRVYNLRVGEGPPQFDFRAVYVVYLDFIDVRDAVEFRLLFDDEPEPVVVPAGMIEVEP